MTLFKRSDRVGGQVQKELSNLLVKEIRDPRLDFVTILRVGMTDDLRSARIYFSVGEGKDRIANAIAGFKSASGFLRRRLSRRLELRRMPALEFLYDESIDRATKLNDILKTIENGSKETENK